jgi:hypothetical protein
MGIVRSGPFVKYITKYENHLTKSEKLSLEIIHFVTVSISNPAVTVSN